MSKDVKFSATSQTLFCNVCNVKYNVESVYGVEKLISKSAALLPKDVKKEFIQNQKSSIEQKSQLCLEFCVAQGQQFLLLEENITDCAACICEVYNFSDNFSEVLVAVLNLNLTSNNSMLEVLV